jgi:dolichol kinase
MSLHPLAGDAQAVLTALHLLLRDFGKLSRRETVASALAETLEALTASARQLQEAASAQESDALGDALDLLLTVLPEAPGEGASFTERAGWETRLQEAYDTLCAQVNAWGVDLSMYRPANSARGIMHVFTALTCLILVEHVLSPVGMIITAAVGAACCWGMEIGRIFSKRLNLLLLRFMAAVAHPHERREVNSATWYTTALLILALVFSPKFCAVALVVLGLADPAAAFVGRRWGRIRLINGRSLEGSATFFLVGSGAAFAALMIWHPEISLGFAILIALGAALPAAVTELLSKRVDDNLSIPLAAASGAWLVSLAL